MSKYILLLFCIVQINIYCQSIYKTARDIYLTYLEFEQLSQMFTDLSSINTKHDISKPQIHFHSNLSIAKNFSLLPFTFNPSASKDLWEVLHGAEPNKEIFSNVGNIRNADGTLQANRLLIYQEDLRKIIDAIEAAKDSEEALTTFKLEDIQPFAAADGLVSGIYPMDSKITGGIDDEGNNFFEISHVFGPNQTLPFGSTRSKAKELKLKNRFYFSTYSPIQNKNEMQIEILMINP